MPKSKARRKKQPKRVLALPDLEQAKMAVLNSLTSASGQRTYEHAIREFVAWYCSGPRLAFNRTVVLRYRIHLEQRGYAPATINLRLAAVRRIAYEAADAGLLSPELAAGIRRVKGIRRIGVRLGNWLTPEQGRRLLLECAVPSTARELRDHAMVAMLIGCGLRRAELLALRLESIQQRDDHWVIADLVGKASLVRTGVQRDLERGLTHPATGRHGVTAPQVLRSLILMRVKNWDFRELRERIADGYTLRHFTQFESQPVLKHDAFNRAFNRLTPDTLRAINDAIVHAAVALDLEDGRKLRVDTTVVETNIHRPTDNTLLWDSVRVLTRLVRQLDDVLPRGVGPFTNRTRAARRRMQEIQRMTAKERHTQQLPTYRALIGITEQVVKAARAVVARTHGRGSILTRLAVQALQREITRHCALGARVIGQTRRRVLHGEQVPTEEKVYSIFETHTDLIKRGKVLKPIEFGHKVSSPRVAAA